MKNVVFWTVCILFGLIHTSVRGQNSPDKVVLAKSSWVQQKMDSMTLDEKIGQLLMLRAHSDKGKAHEDQVRSYIKKYHVGSLCFFQGTPKKQAMLTNEYQKLSKIPLIIAMDAEWGLGMRMPKSTISYPRQLTLGAISDNKAIYDMGIRIAYELKRLGVHLSFSPVADVNNNPKNPVINNRSFGENRYNVASKSIEYMRGLQDAGIIACAKHFPGHGDTDKDSHYSLPVITHSRKRLDSIELYPFQTMIERGVKSVMVAHLHVPSLDNRPNRPSTLSKATVQGLLKDEMGFKGLTITDAMEMEGVTKQFASGQAEAEAIMAGNDILCLPVNLPKVIFYIKKYIKEGKIPMSQIDESVRKILGAKFDLGFYATPQVLLNDLDKDLNSFEGLSTKGLLFEKAITLVHDHNNSIPFRNLKSKSYATIAIGSNTISPFQKRVETYVAARHFNLSHKSTGDQKAKVKKAVKSYDRIIVSLQDMSKYAHKNFGLNKATIAFIKDLASTKEVILVVFGSPYSLKYFENISTIVMSYTDDKIMQDKTAQALFGAIDIRGRLPVGASQNILYGQGIQRSGIQRLGYGMPEEVGMYSDSLAQIEELVQKMIKTKAAPGCQILVARKGKVVYHRAFGTKDYKAQNKVELSDVYDVASITKIAAGTIGVMKLDNEQRVNLHGTLRPYFTQLDTSNKKDLIIHDILSHHAGLVGWIPFYTKTIDVKTRRKKKVLDTYYRSVSQDSFSIPVAENLFLRSDYVDTIWQQIIASDLRKNNRYKYSDLGFYFAKRIIEKTTNMPMDAYLKETYYSPLGLRRTGYNPRQFVPLEAIVPTEKDNYFRNQVLRGYVHDMGAAMMGGVSGHAGLFTNSYELAVIMQMLLNEGNYGGQHFLNKEIVKKYTTRHPRSTRRGIGFDMKELDANKYLNMSELASESTFGHLGFTGTCAFVDPEQDLVYILLSNRTFPTMKNNKFGRKNYRPRIQSIIYNSIKPTVCLP